MSTVFHDVRRRRWATGYLSSCGAQGVRANSPPPQCGAGWGHRGGVGDCTRLASDLFPTQPPPRNSQKILHSASVKLSFGILRGGGRGDVFRFYDQISWRYRLSCFSAARVFTASSLLTAASLLTISTRASFTSLAIFLASLENKTAYFTKQEFFFKPNPLY